MISLSNTSQHSTNVDVIADVKSKIIVSRRHFFVDIICSATSKIQNHQNKTVEKNINVKNIKPIPNKYVLNTYFKEF